MSFRITGLDVTPFQPLFDLSDDELRARGIKRVIADASGGFPDRVELRDAQPGEALLLLNWQHQPADTPYQASHAIYVLEGARERFDAVDTVPELLRKRLLSVRAFDDKGWMRDADVVEGTALEPVIERMLGNPKVGYLHVHYAKPGCFAARVERA